MRWGSPGEVLLGGRRFTLRRQRRTVEFVVAGGRIQDVAPCGGLMQGGRFRVRVGHGRLKARWVTNSRADAPPNFRGRLTQRGSSLVVRGRVRESRLESGYANGFAILTLFMLIPVGVGIHSFFRGPVQLAPLLIGLVAGSVFALLTVLFNRMRGRFAAAADDLVDSLRGYLTTGDPGTYPD